MSRPINADTIAELAKDSFITAHLVKIDFSTGYIRHHIYCFLQKQS